MPLRKLARYAAIANCLACAALVTASAQEVPGRALEAVRQQIQALQSRLSAQHADRDAHSQALRRVEQDIAGAQQKLKSLRQQQAQELERQRGLARQTTEAEGRLHGEQTALAQQVRLSFMTGREELFKLLMSQEDPARLGRMLVYYDYFNEARSRRIGTVSSELETLARLADESVQTRQRLEKLEQQVVVELDNLAASRASRQQMLATLDSSIATSDQEIARLRSEETRLGKLIEELRSALSEFPVAADEPITALRGQLPWPVPGRIVGDYGRPRVGQTITWNGVLLEAEAGTPVRAIYHGRVAFADWLNGLGLLIIVDHGDGYMSLYGHNQALLKESGDWVTPGETIAEVGDSGGQSHAGLYFEMRRNGQPTNPHAWIKGSPRAP
jgi:septal ring factor EnvC (AmiA/AmiB activator)